MSELPRFKRVNPERARKLAGEALTPVQDALAHSQLRELVEYGDGHFRAIFDKAYFRLPPGQTEPTRSQWSTLKKRFKRHDPQVFIFKEHGTITYGQKETLLYLDFAYFAE